MTKWRDPPMVAGGAFAMVPLAALLIALLALMNPHVGALVLVATVIAGALILLLP